MKERGFDSAVEFVVVAQDGTDVVGLSEAAEEREELGEFAVGLGVKVAEDGDAVVVL